MNTLYYIYYVLAVIYTYILGKSLDLLVLKESCTETTVQVIAFPHSHTSSHPPRKVWVLWRLLNVCLAPLTSLTICAGDKCLWGSVCMQGCHTVSATQSQLQGLNVRGLSCPPLPQRGSPAPSGSASRGSKEDGDLALCLCVVFTKGLKRDRKEKRGTGKGEVMGELHYTGEPPSVMGAHE